MAVKRLFLIVMLGMLGICSALNAAPDQPFSLITGEQWTGQEAVSLSFNPPQEFDSMTKAQVMALRKQAVLQHSDLIEGSYEYSPAIFGQIEDGLPWWGFKGQFCFGPGPKSIEGVSEESRFLLNPYLLLMLDATNAFINPDPICFAAQPSPPQSAVWYPAKKELVLVYNVSHYFAQCVALHGKFCREQLRVDALNARDFGFSYIYFDDRNSYGVSALTAGASAFEDVYQLKDYIHRGQSCGYSGGCNNGSPEQPHMKFHVDYFPGQLAAGLWYHKPQQKYQNPDVTVRMLLQ
ncbi:MAG: hypothetical protein H6753_00405 [Candidatus Omnitrophica bacterium]|nr:hypothetical protein [Candidatus Omnitrophota bacterium]